ncbi:MAG: hypothetical protein ACLTWO_10605 [Blautia massiliensis (ex Durand et al. 2017)]|nr:MAG: hypothetical protein DBX91_06970 [Subdoligranulum variabile]
MKQAWIKAFVGKLAATGALLLFLILVPSAASGVLPLWAALLLGAAGVLILNAACGALLPKEQPAQPAAAAPRQVPLRVVRGGRAA